MIVCRYLFISQIMLNQTSRSNSQFRTEDWSTAENVKAILLLYQKRPNLLYVLLCKIYEPKYWKHFKY